jgi:hypothetical protein
MQLHSHRAKLSAIRTFSAPMRCPHCGHALVLVGQWRPGPDWRLQVAPPLPDQRPTARPP